MINTTEKTFKIHDTVVFKRAGYFFTGTIENFSVHKDSYIVFCEAMQASFTLHATQLTLKS